MLEAYFYIVDLQFPWGICENSFPVLFLNHYPVFSKNCLTSPSGKTDSSRYTPLPELSAAFGPLALRGALVCSPACSGDGGLWSSTVPATRWHKATSHSLSPLWPHIQGMLPDLTFRVSTEICCKGLGWITYLKKIEKEILTIKYCSEKIRQWLYNP